MKKVGRPKGSKIRPERIKMGIVIKPHLKKWLKDTGLNQSRLIEEAVIKTYNLNLKGKDIRDTIAVVEVIQNGEKHIEERIESVRKP